MQTLNDTLAFIFTKCLNSQKCPLYLESLLVLLSFDYFTRNQRDNALKHAQIFRCLLVGFALTSLLAFLVRIVVYVLVQIMLIEVPVHSLRWFLLFREVEGFLATDDYLTSIKTPLRLVIPSSGISTSYWLLRQARIRIDSFSVYLLLNFQELLKIKVYLLSLGPLSFSSCSTSYVIPPELL